jgi:hypothetical protein
LFPFPTATFVATSVKISGSIPTEIGKCTKLEFLYLGNCILTGTLPTELGYATNLYQLDISFNNGISGTMPEEYTNWTKLDRLSFSETGIIGPIPSGICTNDRVVLDGNADYEPACSCCKYT